MREGSEDVRKFLSFYKSRHSLCVDLYFPAFYQKKPSYEDLAEFVYTVLCGEYFCPKLLFRAGVQDIQLHPVKKLLFIKFTEQQLRDEVVTRLQTVVCLRHHCDWVVNGQAFGEGQGDWDQP